MILYPGISRLQIPKFRMQGWRWLAAVTRMIDREASLSHTLSIWLVDHYVYSACSSCPEFTYGNC
jgi:hypothetical protein